MNTPRCPKVSIPSLLDGATVRIAATFAAALIVFLQPAPASAANPALGVVAQASGPAAEGDDLEEGLRRVLKALGGESAPESGASPSQVRDLARLLANFGGEATGAAAPPTEIVIGVAAAGARIERIAATSFPNLAERPEWARKAGR